MGTRMKRIACAALRIICIALVSNPNPLLAAEGVLSAQERELAINSYNIGTDIGAKSRSGKK